MVPRCYRSLLVVAYVTVWARVVGLRASRWACYCVSIVPSRPPGLAGFSVRGGTGRRTGFRFQCPSWRVGSSPTGRTGWPFGGGLAKIEYVNVPVVELVDAPDLGSGVLCGVWVRLPPGALAAEVFGVSSCRSRSTRVMMGGTWLAGLVQFGRTPVL